MSRLADLLSLCRITGIKQLLGLARHSRCLKRDTRRFAIMHCIIALEKTGLSGQLLAREGLSVDASQGFDRAILATVCEYLFETDVLSQTSPTTYRAKQPDEYRRMLESIYATMAYLEPIQQLDRLITGDLQYGRDVARDDKYDAIASATLTSLFSYGFSWNVLKRAGAGNLIDLGCGTGEYLVFLRRQGFKGKLYGLDLAEDAINEGRRLGYESSDTALFVGDVFDLASALAQLHPRPDDVFSLMFVLHEFNDEQVGRILAGIKKACPQPRVLLTELIGQTSEETRLANKTVLPELKFVHQLSNQILRTPARWKSLFHAAGYQVELEIKNELVSQMCLLFS